MSIAIGDKCARQGCPGVITGISRRTAEELRGYCHACRNSARAGMSVRGKYPQWVAARGAPAAVPHAQLVRRALALVERLGGIEAAEALAEAPKPAPSAGERARVCDAFRQHIDGKQMCALDYGHHGGHVWADHDCAQCGTEHGVCRQCGTTHGQSHAQNCPHARAR